MLIFHKNNKHTPKSLHRRTRILYYFYLDHPVDDIFDNNTKKIFYWKWISNQARQLAKCSKEWHTHNKRASCYGQMLPKNIAESKITSWNIVFIHLLGIYNVKVNQTQPGRGTKEVDFNLTCMNFIDPSIGWFGIAEVPYYDPKEVKICKTNYNNKTSFRTSQFFNNT